MATPSIDIDRLLKLRLVVGRYGEMDIAKWWNTRGQTREVLTAFREEPNSALGGF